VLAWAVSRLLVSRVGFLKAAPTQGPLLRFRTSLFNMRALMLPVLIVLTLGVMKELTGTMVAQSWMVRVAQGLAVIFLIWSFVSHFVTNETVVRLGTWVGIPIAVLYVLGWLDDVTAYLDGISLEVGDIRVSLYALARTVLFGAILFWLGRLSNTAARQVIQRQPKLDIATREVISKLFEIGIFVVIFLLLLQVMGIDLTALAVFGGALGVGLGFGLQQIASNFISGLIILLDRSITIGDYIELEDGRGGRLRKMSMRLATLETFDGKDIMVPLETFVTSSFTNWTHNNTKQRYALNFSVAYSTDLEHLFEIVREVVASHPKVLSGPSIPIEERPDAEIAAFGDSGIDILVEFWMEGIDDGENRVGADLLLMIWSALRQHGIEIPFPQREVRVLNDEIGVRKAE